MRNCDSLGEREGDSDSAGEEAARLGLLGVDVRSHLDLRTRADTGVGCVRLLRHDGTAASEERREESGAAHEELSGLRVSASADSERGVAAARPQPRGLWRGPGRSSGHVRRWGWGQGALRARLAVMWSGVYRSMLTAPKFAAASMRRLMVCRGGAGGSVWGRGGTRRDDRRGEKRFGRARADGGPALVSPFTAAMWSGVFFI